MSAHTPGPWRIIEDGTLSARRFVVTTGEYSDDFEEREDVAEISLPSWSMPDGLRGKRDQSRRAEAKANARLISSAPDMLAALERIKEDLFYIGENCGCDYGCSNCERVEDASERIVAAIAKSRGAR